MPRAVSRLQTPNAWPANGKEHTLLARVGAGDLQAFEQLYRIYQPRLGRFLTNLLQRPHLVEEVLDDTMVVVWQSADRFRGSSKVSTWIFTIAYRKALKARRRWPDPVEQQEYDVRVSDDPLPDQQLDTRRLHGALIDAMKHLSAEHRAVVDLTYFHGMSYRQIAEIVNCPEQTVKTRMFHAKRRLREAISGRLEDWL